MTSFLFVLAVEENMERLHRPTPHLTDIRVDISCMQYLSKFIYATHSIIVTSKYINFSTTGWTKVVIKKASLLKKLFGNRIFFVRENLGIKKKIMINTNYMLLF